MVDQVTFIFQQYPFLQHLVAIIVVGRLLFKPIFQILGKWVELTVEEDDNKKLHKFMKSKTYRMAVFIVDLLSSVKLPNIKKK